MARSTLGLAGAMDYLGAPKGPERPCGTCGALHTRGPRAKECADCRRRHAAAQQRRRRAGVPVDPQTLTIALRIKALAKERGIRIVDLQRACGASACGFSALLQGRGTFTTAMIKTLQKKLKAKLVADDV